jgi:ABC-2 type transport system permease protein
VTALRNISAILGKEWRQYFASPIAWVALSMWTLLFGGFFYLSVGYFLEVSMSGQRFGGGLSLNDMVVARVLQNMCVVMLFVIPLLTMRLFAEEKRQGTIELLATAPLTDWQIVMGKFLAALSLFAVMLATGFLNFLVLWRYATNAPDWRPVATGALALLLLGASFIALGLFLSTLTSNQIVAATLTFGALLLLWIVGWLDSPGATGPAKWASQLGLINHVEDLMKGIIDLKDIAFYLSFTAYSLFLALQSVESQRWRA